MPRGTAGFATWMLGLCFLAFYLTGRLLFMERLDAAMAAANVHSVQDIIRNHSAPVLVWLLWATRFGSGRSWP